MHNILLAIYKSNMIHINSDKVKHDKPSNDRSALFPCIRSALYSSRCRVAASDKQPSSSSAVIPKPFDTITVMHLDPKGTTEYEILGDGAKMIGEDELPDASTFDRSKRNLLIIDEINIRTRKPAYKKKFDRLFNYCSTHCSLSIICQVQDAFTLPVSCRRAMNHWALWRSSDSFVTNTLGRRLGIKQLGDIFDELELGAHDYVWVDLSGNGPKLRKNLTHVITINE